MHTNAKRQVFVTPSTLFVYLSIVLHASRVGVAGAGLIAWCLSLPCCSCESQKAHLVEGAEGLFQVFYFFAREVFDRIRLRHCHSYLYTSPVNLRCCLCICWQWRGIVFRRGLFGVCFLCTPDLHLYSIVILNFLKKHISGLCLDISFKLLVGWRLFGLLRDDTLSTVPHLPRLVYLFGLPREKGIMPCSCSSVMVQYPSTSSTSLSGLRRKFGREKSDCVTKSTEKQIYIYIYIYYRVLYCHILSRLELEYGAGCRATEDRQSSWKPRVQRSIPQYLGTVRDPAIPRDYTIYSTWVNVRCSISTSLRISTQRKYPDSSATRSSRSEFVWWFLFLCNATPAGSSCTGEANKAERVRKSHKRLWTISVSV